MGLGALAAAISEDADAIEEMYEPFLLQDQSEEKTREFEGVAPLVISCPKGLLTSS